MRERLKQEIDLVFVAWASTAAVSMWNALDQQGVFDSVDTVVTGLSERATWPSFDPALGRSSS